MKSLRLACALSLISFVVIACSSGGSEEPSPEFLMVVQTSPRDDAKQSATETRIGFQVDGEIDPDTLTSDAFFVTDQNGTRLQGERVILQDDPTAAEIVLDAPLDVITTYTATITTRLQSLGGRSLEENYEWTFETLDSAWGVSEWIEEDVFGTSAAQQAAVDGQSNAIAVWEHGPDQVTAIWANRYTKVGLWGEPVAIDDGNGGAAAPQIALDKAGNGIAVWERSEDGGFTANIWTNRYDVATETWGTPELLQSGDITNAEEPQVAMADSGGGIAAWVQLDDETSGRVVWARAHSVASGWGTAQLISEPTPATRILGELLLDCDSAGNAIAVWSRPTVDGDVIWANRYTAASGWGEALLIKDDGATSARRLKLSVGPGGDSIAVWIQDNGTRDDIWAARFSDSAWGQPERIDRYDADDKNDPDVAVDGSGVAHAVWSQTDPDFANIWSSQYTRGSGWGAPELIEPPNDDPRDDADAVTPSVGINSLGNAFVVWLQRSEGWASVWSNRLDPGGPWLGAELIEEITDPARAPLVVVDEERRAHAVWLHVVDDGFDWVRTNRFE